MKLRNLSSFCSQRPILVLLSCYSAAWASMLFIYRGKWWDDWALFAFNQEELTSYFNEIGRPWWGYLHSTLRSSPINLYPIITFLLFAIVNILFFKILTAYAYPVATRSEVLWTSIVFSTLPLVSSRSLAIFMPFILGLVLFFGAWFLLIRSKGKILNQICISVLFIASFTTSSLIVFFVLPVLFTYFRQIGYSTFDPRRIFKFFSQNWIWLISPVLFWLPSRIFFSPKGIAQDYNNAFNFNSPKVVFAFFIVLIATAIFGLLSIALLVKHNKFSFYYSGFFFIGLGAIPYISVNKIPIFVTGFDDRYLLLAPAGISIFLLGIYQTVKKRKNKTSTLGSFVLIVLLILSSNLQTLSLAIDNKKQLEIIEYFRINSLPTNVNMVGVNDNCQHLNVGNRDYTHYELSGMISDARSQNDVLGFELNPQRIIDFKNIINDQKKSYFVGSIRDFTRPKLLLELTINCSKGFAITNFLFGKPLISFSTQSDMNTSKLF